MLARLAAAIVLSIACSTPAIGQERPLTPEDSKRHILSFVASVGSMAGAVSACDRLEYDLIRQCSAIIVGAWPILTRMPPVEADDIFRERLSRTWADFVDSAAAIQSRDRPLPCAEVVAASRGSPIWDICERPGSGADRSQPGVRRPNRAPDDEFRFQ